MFKVQRCFCSIEEATATQSLFKPCKILCRMLALPAQAFYDLCGLQHWLSNHNVDIILLRHRQSY